MSNPSIISKNIDFLLFIDTGAIEDVTRYTLEEKKCYIISNIHKDTKEIDVSSIIKKASISFDENLPVIIQITSQSTKINIIKNAGKEVYLHVNEDFSIPDQLKIKGQHYVSLVSKYAGKIQGSTKSDKIYSSTGNDEIHGSTGNDEIYGNNGDDILHGGGGKDEIHGCEHNDKIYGEAGNDILRGDNGNDLLMGGGDSDLLMGGDGDDTLYGEAGDDILRGDSGNDILHGGSGSNAYHFNSTHNESGHTVMHINPDIKTSESIVFFSEEQQFIAVWSDHEKKIKLHMLNSKPVALDNRYDNNFLSSYSGNNNISIHGYSKPKKIFIECENSPSQLLVMHNVTYTLQGQEKNLQILLPEGEKNIFLPKACKLIELKDSKNRIIAGATKRTFTDLTKNQELNMVFGINGKR